MANDVTPSEPLIIQPGIYWDLPASVYHGARALSNSGMTRLEVSELHYWYTTINPDRPEPNETPEMRLGTALHAAVLEHDTFLDRYDVGKEKADFPGALNTIPEIKAWLVENGGAVKGPNKPDFIKEAVRVAKSKGITVEIWDDIEARQTASCLSRGITPDRILDKVEWERVNGMARALLAEDALRPILARGRKEVSVFVIDPETKVLLKIRTDWIQQHKCPDCGGEATPGCVCRGTGYWGGIILDLKTLSLAGSTVDGAVVKALRYRGYIRQAWFYRYVLKLAGLGDFRWINAFVESDAPYEVRLRELGPNVGKTSRYWEAVGTQTLRLIKRYAESCAEFGDAPWKYFQSVTPLRDSEVPGMAFSDFKEED